MRRLVFVLFFLSGALGLLYEVVWLRLLILAFGSTHFAVTSILTAFMAGLALGSFLLGRWAAREGIRPLGLYGMLEIGIGIYALLVPMIFGTLAPLSAALLPPSASFFAASVVRSALALAVLILPTALMGGTLPVLSRLVVRREGEIGFSAGALYSVNTFGAVIGTALTGFALIPVLGVRATTWIAAIGNVALGAIALVADRSFGVDGMTDSPERSAIGEPANRSAGAREGRKAETAGSARAPAARRGRPESGGSVTEESAPAMRSTAALWAIAGSGFIALLYEIAWTRVLVLVVGSSVYAFTAMLATFLAGLAAGAAAGSWIADRTGRGRRGMEALAAAVALSALSGYATMHLLQRLPAWFAMAFGATGVGTPALAGTWTGAAALVAIEFGLAFLVMFPATFFSGTIFPIAVRQWAGDVGGISRSVGTVYAANTAGTILGSALGGFVILPRSGLQNGILVAAAGGQVIAAAVAWGIPGWPAWKRWSAAALLAAAGAIFVAARPAWDPLVMNSGVFQYAEELGGRGLTVRKFASMARSGLEMLFYEEGMTASVLVARQTASDNVWMAINGKLDASSKSDIDTQLLLGHLPMLFTEAARKETAGARSPITAVVIGYASGMTTGAVTRHDPAAVTAVEIEPAVFRASRYFDDHNHRPLSDSRVRVVEGDGRNFLLLSRERYDAVISEPSNPWMTVASNLFTREFFEIAKSRLEPGGILCQWVQTYGLRPDHLRALVRTFASVFPNVNVFLSIRKADIILLGSDAPLVVDLDALASAIARPEVASDLARIRAASVPDLLTYRIMGDAEARAFAGGGPLNTDDRPLIEFGAPLSLHAETREPNQRALDEHSADPLVDAVGMPGDPERAAGVYLQLAEAYLRHHDPLRAAGAAGRAQSIHPTAEGATALASYEDAARKVPR